MTTRTKTANLAISEGTAVQAQELTAAASDSEAVLVLKTPDGQEHVLPEGLQNLLRTVVHGVANGEGLRIGRLADELTSTVAAEALGVSRPTLLKMAARGEINSFKVGTHTRFHRSEVDRVREARRRQRTKAFNKLRELDERLEIDN